ncbi:hypothetical protein L9F63_027251 [Diploptera punctata]|uniref:Uncharacterized protein n=1 Tax=Diploptera punctata TaxID=6984 RepID=A0AAD8EMK2_DIPPU|nr:hypothetical protein L9F63_027251 [Diploptera punctata]
MPMYCENDPCATYNCTEGVPDKHKLPCGPNQYNRTGGFCNCCEVCITIVEEGGACPVIAGPPVYDICDEGLICDVNATCVISF